MTKILIMSVRLMDCKNSKLYDKLLSKLLRNEGIYFFKINT